MRRLATLLTLIAALVPAAAWAHCCCDHPGKHHHAARKTSTYHAERSERWRYDVVTNRSCDNYPGSAMRAGASGVAWVNIRVGDDGWPDSVRLSRSSGRADLDRATLACVRNWHFRDGYDWRQARVTWRFHWVTRG